MTNEQAVIEALDTECRIILKRWRDQKLAPEYQLRAVESMVKYLERKCRK